MNPPDIMPNGNVGTPTKVFLQFIKECRLPPGVIKKLGLSFPKTRTNKKYGMVPYEYGGDVVAADPNAEGECVKTGSGHEILQEGEIQDLGTGTSCKNREKHEKVRKGKEKLKKSKEKEEHGPEDSEGVIFAFLFSLLRLFSMFPVKYCKNTEKN